MKSSLHKILLVGVFALTCLLSIGTAGMTPPPGYVSKHQVKGIQNTQQHLAESPIPSSSTSSSSTDTVDIKDNLAASIPSTFSTTTSSSVPPLISFKENVNSKDKTPSPENLSTTLQQKTTLLLGLQNEFKTNSTLHHSFVSEKLQLVNATLLDIADVLAGAQSDAHVKSQNIKILQKILFSRKKGNNGKKGKSGKENGKIDVKKLLKYLNQIVGEDQQIDFRALTASLECIFSTLKDIEEEMGRWTIYVAEVEGRVLELLENSEDEAEEFSDVSGSLAGAMVRVKSGLSTSKSVMEDEDEVTTEGWSDKGVLW